MHSIAFVRTLVGAFFALTLVAAAPTFAQGNGPTAFSIEELNPGLPQIDPPVRRDTAQAAMEAFLAAVDAENFDRAAHFLDLSLIAEQDQAELGPLYARQLAEVIDRKVLINWDLLLDRPDQLDANGSTDSPVAGQARKSIVLDLLDLGTRPVSLRLNRLNPENADAVWVFASQSVENVPALYDLYGPTRLERALPPQLRQDAFWGLAWWELIAIPLVLIFTGFVVTVIWRALTWAGKDREGTLLDDIARAIRLPATLLVATIILDWTTSNLFIFSGIVSSILAPLIVMFYVAAAILFFMAVIDSLLESLVDTDTEESLVSESNENVRRVATNVSAARRIAILLAIVAGVGIVLSQTEVFGGLGITLFASAGALSLILGFAAREVLGNIMASLQIALNRSARIGDQLTYQGELCYVERIHFTFVQLRHWSGNRLIVPVSKFVSEMFENRSLETTNMTRFVKIHLSHEVDMDEVREAFHKIVSAKDTVNHEEAAIRVVAHDAAGMIAMCEVPIPNISDGWEAECEVREEMIAAIRQMSGANGSKPFPQVKAAVEIDAL